MGRLEFATPKEAWGGEAEAFTPLLAAAELLEYLGRETGIGPLLHVETEHTTAGSRSLDILAETPDGRRVAIENQYHQADHDHLTRGLAYAVAADARALIVIAENHRDEFIAVAGYLNDIAAYNPDEAVQVWLAQVRAIRRVGDDVWSPVFVVQAQPNEWEAAIRRDTTPRLGSLEDFYGKCGEATGDQWASNAREIVEEWLSHPGASEDHNTKQTVGLYLPKPSDPDRRTNVLQLGVNGSLYICRGYLLDSSGLFDPDVETEDLDERIRADFPDARWSPQAYYITAVGAQPGQVSSFSAWLRERFDE